MPNLAICLTLVRFALFGSRGSPTIYSAMEVSVTVSRTKWSHPFSSGSCSIVSRLGKYDFSNVSKVYSTVHWPP